MFSNEGDSGGILAGALLLAAIFCPLLQEASHQEWEMLSFIFVFSVCTVLLGFIYRIGYVLWKLVITSRDKLASKILRWSVYIFAILAIEYAVIKK